MGYARNIVKGCMSVLYQNERSDLAINKTERIRRKLFKKMPSGVFEKFPFTFFEVTHKFAVGTK
jgi:hypothetical protein